MKRTSILKNTTRSILLAGVMCGMVGAVHAQIRGGPGQVGGMGQGGAPAGEFPSDPKNTMPSQGNTKGGSISGPSMSGKKDSSKDSSKEQAPIKRDSGVDSSASKGSSTSGTPPGPGGY
jgi:hypothetical protein